MNIARLYAESASRHMAVNGLLVSCAEAELTRGSRLSAYHNDGSMVVVMEPGASRNLQALANRFGMRNGGIRSINLGDLDDTELETICDWSALDIDIDDIRGCRNVTFIVLTDASIGGHALVWKWDERRNANAPTPLDWIDCVIAACRGLDIEAVQDEPIEML